MAILFWLITSHTSYAFKNRTLEFLDCKNILDTKNRITDIIFKYNFIINKKSLYEHVHNSIWTPVFNPIDPESSWGTRIHKTVYPLTGQNVEIVPPQAKGYLMDSTCNASYFENIDLCMSYSLVVILNTIKGEHYKASVYCYVSNDFDGSVAYLGFDASTNLDKIVVGKLFSFYDLNKKGTWQKLDLDFGCNGGEASIYLWFNKRGIRDFSFLKGHVIFAYPEYEKTKIADSVLSFNIPEMRYCKKNDKLVNSRKYTSQRIFYNANTELPKVVIIDKSKYYIKNKPNQHIEIQSVSENTTNYSRASLFAVTVPLFTSNLNKQDKDPVRNWVTGFISEDTTYHGYKNKLFVSVFWNKYGEERSVRCFFGTQIFLNEYNTRQKIFGGGFNFLNWYGYYFLKDKTKSDWPHNPFLTILLYSGIFGLMIYCFFLYKVFYYYLKYIKEYPLLFIFFLITFFFSFFSGGSPFDPPIMGFFSILPFFIHSVHERERQQIIQPENAE